MFVENLNNKRWCKAWQGEEGGHKKRNHTHIFIDFDIQGKG